SLGGTHDVEHARTMAMVALVVASAALTAGLAGLRSRSALVAISATLLSAVVLIQTPTLAALLHLSPLHADDWLIAATAGAVAGGLSALIPLLRGQAAAQRRR
ncbi:MAG TPA: cation transporting ATPase C-terminal domain-containing protein, partial [Burkholderiaceae bacterium]|nr:cation transporting ATPase C-terminal domain-containing protein [Burkholderiaceae bacterium]